MWTLGEIPIIPTIPTIPTAQLSLETSEKRDGFKVSHPVQYMFITYYSTTSAAS